MKGGTNDLHGTFSEYVRNNIFDAVATQTNSRRIRATQHQWNDFSALVSGPIVKNKLFFSSWYEGFRERIPFPVDPVRSERAGTCRRLLRYAQRLGRADRDLRSAEHRRRGQRLRAHGLRR